MKLYLVEMIDITDKEGLNRSNRYIGIFDSAEKAKEVMKAYKRGHTKFSYIATQFYLNEIFPGAPTGPRKSALVDRETMAKLGYARVSTNKGKY